MLQALAAHLSALIYFGVLLIAAVIGSGRARIAAVALATAAILSLVSQAFATTWAPTLMLGVIDGVLLLVFVRLTWKAGRLWPVAAAALQGVLVALDALKALEPKLQTYTFLSLANLTSYGMLLPIAYGAWVSRRWRR